MSVWIIPYVDQPPAFWEDLARQFGAHVRSVYFPMPGDLVASGRSRQPDRYLDSFLRSAPFSKMVLVNPILLPRPVEELAPGIVAALRRLQAEYGLSEVTVSSLALARHIRAALPDFRITASTLMGIATPMQALMAQDAVDVLVPDTRLLRDLPGLRRLREAFRGEMRLIVNEACLLGCPYRGQHFYEMGYGDWFPQSLCQTTLAQHPWLRLTGAWILPRHLTYYAGLYDSLKLAGRVALRDPARYHQVLGAYVHCGPILPRDIGGGPASLVAPIDLPDAVFEKLLNCDKNCPACGFCQQYYTAAVAEQAVAA
jgi:hypothetical protein